MTYEIEIWRDGAWWPVPTLEDGSGGRFSTREAAMVFAAQRIRGAAITRIVGGIKGPDGSRGGADGLGGGR